MNPVAERARHRTLLLLMACVVVLSGCATVPLAPVHMDQQARLLTPKSGKALVYLYRPRMFSGAAVRMVLFNDKGDKMVLAPNTFSVWEVEAGLLTIMAGPPRHFYSFPLREGRRYFLKCPGVENLLQVTEGEARSNITSCGFTLPSTYAGGDFYGLFRGSRDADSAFADVYHSRGNSYLDMGDIDMAVENYTHAIDSKPNLAARSHLMRGAAYIMRGKDDLAEQDLDKAIILPHNNTYNQSAVSYVRGKALDTVNPTNDAIAAYEGFLQVSDRLYTEHIARGCVFGGLGALAAATDKINLVGFASEPPWEVRELREWVTKRIEVLKKVSR